MFRAVIVTGPGFQDHDVIYSYYRLKEEGYVVDVATKQGLAVTGRHGVSLPIDRSARSNVAFGDLSSEHYDAVILTGGHEAADHLRQDRDVLAFVHAMDSDGKVVGAICHGMWIMISAKITAGRTACADGGVADDVANSGADVIPGEVAVDDNIVTCSYYGSVGMFLRTLFDVVAQRAAPLAVGVRDRIAA